MSIELLNLVFGHKKAGTKLFKLLADKVHVGLLEIFLTLLSPAQIGSGVHASSFHVLLLLEFALDVVNVWAKAPT